MLTIERLKEVLHYNEDTGIFTWKAGKRKGIAGHKNKRGYIIIGGR